MDTLFKILLVIIGLGFIIFVHELGHFLVAKWNRVRCDVFSLGFGPALVRWRPRYPWRPGAKDFRYNDVLGPELLDDPQKLRWALRARNGSNVGNRLRVLPWAVNDLKPGMVRVVRVEAEECEQPHASFEPQRLDEAAIAELREAGVKVVQVFDAGETEYRLSILPLGGYVQMAGGEIHGDNQQHVPDEFLSKKPGPRAAILSAGVAMNIVTGFLMFIVAYGIGVETAPPVIGDADAVVVAPAEPIDTAEDNDRTKRSADMMDLSRPGPAWTAGLRAGDRVVNLQVGPRGGEEPADPGPEEDREDLDFTDVRIAVAFTNPDQSVWLTVLREEPDGEVRRRRFGVDPVYSNELGFMVLGVRQLIAPAVQAIAANRAEALEGKLKPGDHIVAVNGTPLRKAFPVPEGASDDRRNLWPRSYPHFLQLVREATERDPSAPILLRLIRDGEAVDSEVEPYRQALRVRLGIDRTPVVPVRAVRPGGPADTAVLGQRNDAGEWTPSDERFALSPGDLIEAVNGERAESWEGLLRSVHALNEGEWARLSVTRPGNDGAETRRVELFTMPVADPDSGQTILEFIPDMRGLFDRPEETLVVRGLDPLGPATDATLLQVRTRLPDGVEAAPSLQSGDRIVKVNDVPVQAFASLTGDRNITSVEEIVASAWDRQSTTAPAVRLEVVRELPAGDAARGESIRATLLFEVTPRAYGRDLQYRIGFAPTTATVTRQYWGPEAISVGLEKTVVMAQQVFLTIRSLFAGTVDVKNIGGPVMIADASYRFAGWGIGTFIYFMAIISINLAIINILPIPLLDGGHLVFLAAEKVRGKPVPERIQAIFAYIGLALLLTLIVFVTINDISRLVN